MLISHARAACLQNDDLVLLTCVDFGHLITKKKPEEDDKIEDLVNPHSVRDCFGFAVPPQSCAASTGIFVKGGTNVVIAHVSCELCLRIGKLQHFREQHWAWQLMQCPYERVCPMLAALNPETASEDSNCARRSGGRRLPWATATCGTCGRATSSSWSARATISWTARSSVPANRWCA